MKKVFFAALAIAASVSFVNAQDAVTTDNTAKTAVLQEEKMKIKTAELPAAVTKALAADEYKGWTADTAYQLKPSGNYEVTVKKGTESKTIVFDKDGNKIG